jgi:choice-of-anchor C domain-containing protein
LKRRLLTVSLFAAFAAAEANGNLLTNASFELAACGGSVCNSTTPQSWTLVSGDVDLVTSGLWQQAPGGGNQDVDLSGSGPGGILQSFDTTVGNIYNLSFYLAGNPLGGPTVKTLDVLVGPAGGSLATLASPTFDITGQGLANMGYVLESLQFTATSSSTSVEFLSTTAGPSGPVIDNADVELAGTSATPEPSTFVLLGGALALLAHRRERKKVRAL